MRINATLGVGETIADEPNLSRDRQYGRLRVCSGNSQSRSDQDQTPADQRCFLHVIFALAIVDDLRNLRRLLSDRNDRRLWVESLQVVRVARHNGVMTFSGENYDGSVDNVGCTRGAAELPA